MRETIEQYKAPFWSDKFPDIGVGPVDTSRYISQSHFDDEVKYIFSRAWIHIGRLEELPGPGTYITKDLAAPKAMILVTRDHENRVRAFHNVCTHRGNRVAHGASGSVARLSCRFHGWGFGLDGKLLNVPDRERFHQLREKESGLRPINCSVWQGFIFINLDPDPAESLEEFLGQHYKDLEGYPFDEFTSSFGYEVEVNCNWKIGLDAFTEAYHVPFVHPKTLVNRLTTPQNRSNQPLNISLGKYHSKLSLQGNSQTVYGNPQAVVDASRSAQIKAVNPIEQAAFRLGIPSMRAKLKKLAERPLPIGMNPGQSPTWAFDINILYPDFYLSMRPTYYQAFNFRPIAADRMLFEARVYYPKADKPSGRFYQEYMKTLVRDVSTEDFSTTEDVHRGMLSGAIENIYLQENEILPRHHAYTSDAYIRMQKMRRP